MLKIDSLKKSEIEDYVSVVIDAYPDDDRENSDSLVDYLNKSLDKDDYIRYWKAAYGNDIVGTMRFLDYQMNIRNKKVSASGLGLVAVSPLHRKKGIARTMMEFYISENEKAGVDFLILYPFNLAFYRKAGFGYGTKQRMYKLLPSSFPAYPAENLCFMKEEDSRAAWDCFRIFAEKTNGMIFRKEGYFDRAADSIGSRVLVFRKGDTIEGYLKYHYKKEKPDYEYDCNLIVTELVYNSGEALKSFIGFLRNQKDQAVRIHITSQDEYLFFLLDNPLNGEKDTFKTEQLESYNSALSMMYRVTNVSRLFGNFGDIRFGHDDFTMKLSIRDTLYPPNNRPAIISFEKGCPSVCTESCAFDFELSMDISDFSSLFAGAVNLKKLVQFGLAEISDITWLERADRALSYSDKPQCFTGF